MGAGGAAPCRGRGQRPRNQHVESVPAGYALNMLPLVHCLFLPQGISRAPLFPLIRHVCRHSGGDVCEKGRAGKATWRVKARPNKQHFRGIHCMGTPKMLIFGGSAPYPAGAIGP